MPDQTGNHLAGHRIAGEHSLPIGPAEQVHRCAECCVRGDAADNAVQRVAEAWLTPTDVVILVSLVPNSRPRFSATPRP